jgi:hypothetical protein
MMIFVDIKVICNRRVFLKIYFWVQSDNRF